jgi:hypothetical protein
MREHEAAQVVAARTLAQIIDDKLDLHLQLVKDTIAASRRSTAEPGGEHTGERAVRSSNATQPVSADKGPLHLKNLSPTTVSAAAPPLLHPHNVQPRLEEPSVNQNTRP